MTTHLPIDADKRAIQALSLKAGGADAIDATSAQSNISSALNASVVYIYATEAVYLRFGDATVEASDADHYFPKGLYFAFSLKKSKTEQHTHIAAIAVDANATVHISEAQ